MTANPNDIQGLDPEDESQVLGRDKNWGKCNTIELGVKLPDGTNKHVSTAALIDFFESGGGGTGAFYLHTQTTPAKTWTIEHGLNNIMPLIIVIDGAGNEVPVAKKNYVSATPNSITISFGVAISGQAGVYGGAGGGVTVLPDPTKDIVGAETVIGTYADPDTGTVDTLYRKIIQFVTSADGSPVDIDIGLSPKKMWMKSGNLYGKAQSDPQDGTIFSYPLLYTNSQFLMEFMARRIDDKIRIRSMGFPALPGDIWLEYTKNA